MRTSLIPSSRTPFDRLTSILVRVLSLIGIVGLLVVVLHSLPGEKGKAASVSAAPNANPAEAAKPASAPPAQAASPRTVSTSPVPSSAPVQPAAPPQAAAALPSTPAAPAPVAAPPLPKPVPVTPPTAAAQPVPAAQPAPAATRTASVETKPEPAPSAAGRLVDLNTASVEELNKLNGAGMIGRSVVKGRPYASPEDLINKRILNRSTYDRIKDQITVR